MDVLQRLIIHTKQYPSLEGVQSKLECLKRIKTFEKELFALCKEDDMAGFPKYISETIPQDENCSNMQKYPDDFAKNMHLMDLVLHKPIFYSAFKTYCKNRPTLQPYISEDISITDEMIGYVSMLFDFSLLHFSIFFVLYKFIYHCCLAQNKICLIWIFIAEFLNFYKLISN